MLLMSVVIAFGSFSRVNYSGADGVCQEGKRRENGDSKGMGMTVIARGKDGLDKAGDYRDYGETGLLNPYTTSRASFGRALPPWTDGSAHHLAESSLAPR